MKEKRERERERGGGTGGTEGIQISSKDTIPQKMFQVLTTTLAIHKIKPTDDPKKKSPKIEDLQKLLIQANEQIEQQNYLINGKTQQINNFEKQLTRKNHKIKSLQKQLNKKDIKINKIKLLKRQPSEKLNEINTINQTEKQTKKFNETKNQINQIEKKNQKKRINFEEIFLILQEPKTTEQIYYNSTEEFPQTLNNFLSNRSVFFENCKSKEQINQENINSLKNEIQEIYQKIKKNYEKQQKINKIISDHNINQLFHLKQNFNNNNDDDDDDKGIQNKKDNDNNNNLEKKILVKNKLIKKFQKYIEKIKIKINNFQKLFFYFKDVKVNLFEDINDYFKINLQIYKNNLIHNLVTYIKEFNNFENIKLKEFNKKKYSISKIFKKLSKDLQEKIIITDQNELNSYSLKYQNSYEKKINEIEELKLFIGKIQIIKRKLIDLKAIVHQLYEFKEKLNIINLLIHPYLKYIEKNNKLKNKIPILFKNDQQISQKIKKLKRDILNKEEKLEESENIPNNQDQIKKIENSINELEKNKKKFLKKKIKNYQTLILIIFKHFPEQISEKNISLRQFSNQNKKNLLEKLKNKTKFTFILKKKIQELNPESINIQCIFKILFNFQKKQFQNIQSTKNDKIDLNLIQICTNSNINKLQEIKNVQLTINNDNNNKNNKNNQIKFVQELVLENHFCFYYFHDNFLIEKPIIFKFQNQKILFIYDLKENGQIKWKSNSNDQIFKVIHENKNNAFGPIELGKSDENLFNHEGIPQLLSETSNN
ncbi:hypothetical protein M0812_28504 [Anaeramoeba flamelloides]|uniref:Uncharacterized protein n=1 Tax=Anaeramoeba flamelloides TaxID=1746091 RepID=A0AAV7YBX0_9EUKA|nr:hypothetical protein M0812_28504 [Anaeramoeba flamelloides]